MASLTAVMYHHVRPIAFSRDPKNKGLEIESFRRQLDYIESLYCILSPQDFLSCVEGKPLPEKAILLTFDDGYLDHFTWVFPELHRRGLGGLFFPPISAVARRQLLPVNKIHYLLASIDELAPVLVRIKEFLAANGSTPGISTYEHYLTSAKNENARFDPPEVIMVKRLLQYQLPSDPREELLDRLFREFVAVDEHILADELYLTTKQLSVMSHNGMLIGSHGLNHVWLGESPEEEQREELSLACDYLVNDVGTNPNSLTLCYPSGSYNETTLSLAREMGYKAAFTTEVALWSGDRASALTIPRLDTNDLPKQANAAPNEWFSKA
jgi:peptidoglycan/xylan/chitin deacetylase (PgdA/CDA1 family)